MELSPQQQLDRMISGYWISQAIYAAASFGIADLLKDGPRGIDELSQASETNTDALYRLLRALASVGVFAELEGKKFQLTPMAEQLRSDIPGSQRALSLMMGGNQFKAFGEINYSIQTGQTSFDKVFGQPIFDHLSENPEEAKIFDAAMMGIHGRESNSVIDAYDFSSIGTLADVGGGNGSQLSAILQAVPQLQGMLFDLPHVIERAKPRLESAGLLGRCQLVGGSFFEKIPSGADVYMMRHIIHDWDDEKSRTILKNIHAAMADDGKLLIVESVIPTGNEPFGGKLLDLVMLLIPGGKERTAEEYKTLLDEAGFRLTQIVPTNCEISVIEAVKK